MTLSSGGFDPRGWGGHCASWPLAAADVAVASWVPLRLACGSPWDSGAAVPGALVRPREKQEGRACPQTVPLPGARDSGVWPSLTQFLSLSLPMMGALSQLLQGLMRGPFCARAQAASARGRRSVTGLCPFPEGQFEGPPLWVRLPISELSAGSTLYQVSGPTAPADRTQQSPTALCSQVPGICSLLPLRCLPQGPAVSSPAWIPAVASELGSLYPGLLTCSFTLFPPSSHSALSTPLVRWPLSSAQDMPSLQSHPEPAPQGPPRWLSFLPSLPPSLSLLPQPLWPPAAPGPPTGRGPCSPLCLVRGGSSLRYPGGSRPLPSFGDCSAVTSQCMPV